MIRPITNINFQSNKYNSKPNKRQTQPTFSGGNAEFMYYGKILKLGKKRFSGEIYKILSDGSKLDLTYLQGLLQKAEKFSSNVFNITKITEKGEEIIPIKIKRKKLFTKKYLYNRSGELFGVNKDGQTVFSKTYKITSAMPNRIYKFINGEKILVATDLRDNKIASTITTTDKHISSIFKNNAVEATESRGYYAQNNKLLKSKLFSTNKTTGQKTLTTFNSDGNIENYIQKDSKNNILTEIHSEFDENGKLMTLVTKQNQYDLISYEYFDTKTGKSLYTKSIDKDGKLRSIMERKYLKGTNHLASENGFILGYSPEYKTQIKMVYNPETHKLKEETTLTKFKDTSSTISSIRTIESEIEKYCQEIKTSNNKIYKHEYIYDNNNNKLLKNNFLSGDKKISELTYWKIYSKVYKVQI